MKVNVIGILCVILIADGALSAKISRKDVNTKPDDEDVYGALGEDDPDLQNDQDNPQDFEDYGVDNGNEPPPEDPERNEVDVDAKLVSKPETFIAHISDKVLLPCQATVEAVRVWEKDRTIIFTDTYNVQRKSNLKLLDNKSLEVTLQSEEDYGEYSCKLGVSDTLHPEIVHKIVRATSPKIVALRASDNKTIYNEGESLTLICEATGYPKPKISWHKENQKLGPEGDTLTIQPVEAKHAGTYRCLADNNVDKPDHKHIDIFVNHRPIVSVEKYNVNSDHESDAELICEVNAFPAPVVNWQKDGLNLVSRERKIKLTRERNNERNLLIIRDITEDDFGQYSCVATNALGTEVKNISLVKIPAMRKLEKALDASTKDVILQWRVESKQPISMHELQYRRKGETSWKTLTPEVTNGTNDVYLIKQTLKNLEPGVYETRARSKNHHGWSDYSDIMPFEGAKHGSHHQKSKHNKKEQKENKMPDPTHDTPAQQRSEEITHTGESTSSSRSLHSSIFLVALTLFARYVYIRQ